jgi:hypothetical protein
MDMEHSELRDDIVTKSIGETLIKLKRLMKFRQDMRQKIGISSNEQTYLDDLFIDLFDNDSNYAKAVKASSAASASDKENTKLGDEKRIDNLDNILIDVFKQSIISVLLLFGIMGITWGLFRNTGSSAGSYLLIIVWSALCWWLEGTEVKSPLRLEKTINRLKDLFG